jgi:hypothetical protein
MTLEQDLTDLRARTPDPREGNHVNHADVSLMPIATMKRFLLFRLLG